MTDDPDRDAHAAEYVLGTLDPVERAAADALRASSAPFDAAIRAWEYRFSPLLDLSSDIEPPAWLKDRVLSEIDRQTPASLPANDNVVLLRRKVTLWRSATAVAAALAAVLGLWVANATFRGGVAGQRSYVAVLQQGTAAPAFLVSLDLDRRTMTVVPSATPQEAGKSYELWMIGGPAGTPQSLGLVDAEHPAHPTLPAVDPAFISKATYAVTLEALGGSPTGQPTSAPVFVGHMVDAAR